MSKGFTTRLLFLVVSALMLAGCLHSAVKPLEEARIAELSCSELEQTMRNLEQAVVQALGDFTNPIKVKSALIDQEDIPVSDPRVITSEEKRQWKDAAAYYQKLLNAKKNCRNKDNADAPTPAPSPTPVLVPVASSTPSAPATPPSPAPQENPAPESSPVPSTPPAEDTGESAGDERGVTDALGGVPSTESAVAPGGGASDNAGPSPAPPADVTGQANGGGIGGAGLKITPSDFNPRLPRSPLQNCKQWQLYVRDTRGINSSVVQGKGTNFRQAETQGDAYKRCKQNLQNTLKNISAENLDLRFTQKCDVSCPPDFSSLEITNGSLGAALTCSIAFPKKPNVKEDHYYEGPCSQPQAPQPSNDGDNNDDDGGGGTGGGTTITSGGANGDNGTGNGGDTSTGASSRGGAPSSGSQDCGRWIKKVAYSSAADKKKEETVANAVERCRQKMKGQSPSVVNACPRKCTEGSEDKNVETVSSSVIGGYSYHIPRPGSLLTPGQQTANAEAEKMRGIGNNTGGSCSSVKQIEGPCVPKPVSVDDNLKSLDLGDGTPKVTYSGPGGSSSANYFRDVGNPAGQGGSSIPPDTTNEEDGNVGVGIRVAAEILDWQAEIRALFGALSNKLRGVTAAAIEGVGAAAAPTTSVAATTLSITASALGLVADIVIGLTDWEIREMNINDCYSLKDDIVILQEITKKLLQGLNNPSFSNDPTVSADTQAQISSAKSTLNKIAAILDELLATTKRVCNEMEKEAWYYIMGRWVLDPPWQTEYEHAVILEKNLGRLIRALAQEMKDLALKIQNNPPAVVTNLPTDNQNTGTFGGGSTGTSSKDGVTLEIICNPVSTSTAATTTPSGTGGGTSAGPAETKTTPCAEKKEELNVLLDKILKKYDISSADTKELLAIRRILEEYLDVLAYMVKHNCPETPRSQDMVQCSLLSRMLRRTEELFGEAQRTGNADAARAANNVREELRNMQKVQGCIKTPPPTTPGETGSGTGTGGSSSQTPRGSGTSGGGSGSGGGASRLHSFAISSITATAEYNTQTNQTVLRVTLEKGSDFPYTYKLTAQPTTTANLLSAKLSQPGESLSDPNACNPTSFVCSFTKLNAAAEKSELELIYSGTYKPSTASLQLNAMFNNKGFTKVLSVVVQQLGTPIKDTKSLWPPSSFATYEAAYTKSGTTLTVAVTLGQDVAAALKAIGILISDSLKSSFVNATFTAGSASGTCWASGAVQICELGELPPSVQQILVALYFNQAIADVPDALTVYLKDAQLNILKQLLASLGIMIEEFGATTPGGGGSAGGSTNFNFAPIGGGSISY